MAGFSTAFPNSFKVELPQGLHNFCSQVTPTGNTTNTSSHVTSVSAMTAVGLGSSVSGTGIPAGSFVADIDSANSFFIGGAGNATATGTGVTLTIAGHVFKCALGIATPTGTYGTTTTNYSNLTGNSDEVTGTGYTAGGFAWTAAQNITPSNTTTQTFWQWSVNPSWTSATFSTSGCIIYNTSQTNRAVYVGSFGGTQTVSGGTLTLLQPTNAAGTALLQLN